MITINQARRMIPSAVCYCDEDIYEMLTLLRELASIALEVQSCSDIQSGLDTVNGDASNEMTESDES